MKQRPSLQQISKHEDAADAGFTLVETVVGLAILSIIVVLCWSSLMSGIETVDTIIQANDNTFNMLQIHQNLNKDLRTIKYPVFVPYDDSKNTRSKLIFNYYMGIKDNFATLEYKNNQLTLTFDTTEINYGTFESIEMSVQIEDVTMPHILISYNDTDILIPLEIPGA